MPTFVTLASILCEPEERFPKMIAKDGGMKDTPQSTGGFTGGFVQEWLACLLVHDLLGAVVIAEQVCLEDVAGEFPSLGVRVTASERVGLPVD